MKTYEGVDMQTHAVLTLALVRGELSALRPGHFMPGEIAPGMQKKFPPLGLELRPLG
jgi:hypothetical protein